MRPGASPIMIQRKTLKCGPSHFTVHKRCTPSFLLKSNLTLLPRLRANSPLWLEAALKVKRTLFVCKATLKIPFGSVASLAASSTWSPQTHFLIIITSWLSQMMFLSLILKWIMKGLSLWSPFQISWWSKGLNFFHRPKTPSSANKKFLSEYWSLQHNGGSQTRKWLKFLR